VLLGAGGLVRAYSSAVSEALGVARPVRRAVLTEVRVDVPHADAGRLHGILRDWCSQHDGALDDVTYGIEAEFTVLVPPTELDRFDADIAATSSGTLTPRRGADRVVDLPG
jgi:putative IMPACT (imprinted ancient) family translation regulator